ncbi:copper ion binding protein [Paenibacillus pini]|uniref:Copper(I) chaperone CopZ n=1 Tax=Paenibacillus pini JCM 16418 TaxID=1236976 RepID=W7Z673_9BACL|nr:copper ion binding protein [Paenibacillus pini]GAF09829.1 copper(I) chaperone CopZ [Paenibacillus pini JCM 16418]
MKNVKLNVNGMSCGHCVNAVEGAVKEAGANGKVDLPTKTVTVDYDENKVSLDAIKAAIEDQGYDVA